MKQKSRLTEFAATMVVVGLLGALMIFWSAVLYVAWHFASKWW